MSIKRRFVLEFRLQKVKLNRKIWKVKINFEDRVHLVEKYKNLKDILKFWGLVPQPKGCMVSPLPPHLMN
jgi:hypothetical protein